MKVLTPAELEELSQRTLSHYEGRAQIFWEGTQDHDVSQNIEALLGALGRPNCRILDFGCGPGRDLLEFQRRGHRPVGLDGCEAFVKMARAHSGSMVLHQSFLELDLGEEEFDGIFANASLFHVPTQELSRVLGQLWRSLDFGGVLFASNPRGENQEGYNGERYGAYHGEDQWWAMMKAAGFHELSHYYRPEGLPREEQPWLASLWAKTPGS